MKLKSEYFVTRLHPNTVYHICLCDSGKYNVMNCESGVQATHYPDLVECLFSEGSWIWTDEKGNPLPKFQVGDEVYYITENDIIPYGTRCLVGEVVRYGVRVWSEHDADRETPWLVGENELSFDCPLVKQEEVFYFISKNDSCIPYGTLCTVIERDDGNVYIQRHDNGEKWTVQESELSTSLPEKEEQFDVVNKPKHYQLLPGVEVIDVLDALCKKIDNCDECVFSAANSSYYSQAMGYLMRFMDKNGKQDVEKAIWYLNRLVENWED